jgi:hypothetical protein
MSRMDSVPERPEPAPSKVDTSEAYEYEWEELYGKGVLTFPDIPDLAGRWLEELKFWGLPDKERPRIKRARIAGKTYTISAEDPPPCPSS